MQHTLIFITTIITLVSCSSTDKADIKETIKVVTVDTLKTARQKSFSEQALKLNLAPIDAGVDSFEMRIWVSSMFVEHDVIVLKHTDASWLTKKIRYYRGNDGLTHLTNETIIPIIPLSLLIDSLKQIRFDKMISQEEIPNFVDNIADGVTYNLEIATKGNYKLLTYHCPGHFSKTEINNQLFLNLLLLVDKYFRFWTPICAN